MVRPSLELSSRRESVNDVIAEAVWLCVFNVAHHISQSSLRTRLSIKRAHAFSAA